MTNEPFRPEDILYRFTPTAEERAYFGYTALIELMVVTAYPYVDWNNLRLVARFPWGLSPLRSLESGVISVLFAHLLRERADLTSERNGWMDTALMFEQQRDATRAELEKQQDRFEHFRDAAHAELARVAAERDGYQDALERLADGESWVTLRPRKETGG